MCRLLSLVSAELQDLSKFDQGGVFLKADQLTATDTGDARGASSHSWLLGASISGGCVASSEQLRYLERAGTIDLQRSSWHHNSYVQSAAQQARAS
jgi:hypothetical protein